MQRKINLKGVNLQFTLSKSPLVIIMHHLTRNHKQQKIIISQAITRITME